MKPLLLITAVLMLFLCSGCKPAGDAVKTNANHFYDFARRLPGELVSLFNQLRDLLGNAGDDVKDGSRDVCNTLRRPEVQQAMAVLDRLPIRLVSQELKLSPAQAARLATVAALSPVLIVRWTATGVAGVTLLCQAIFPNEHTSGTAVVVLCDRDGCGPLKR